MNIYEVLQISLKEKANVRRKSWPRFEVIISMHEDYLEELVDDKTFTWEDLLSDDWEVYTNEQLENDLEEVKNNE